MLKSGDALTSALAHLHEALALLDKAGAPGQIGAHVDLAAHQLQDLLSQPASSRVQLGLGNR